MLGGVAVQVENLQRAAAVRKASGRIRVGTALTPVSPIAPRSLEAAGTADLPLIARSVAPALPRGLSCIVRRAHALNGELGRHPLCQVKAVIRRLGSPLAGILPLMSVTQALALRGADRGRFGRLHPNNRIRARNVWEFVLIDAGLSLLWLLRSAVVQRCHIAAAADFLEPRIATVLQARCLPPRLTLSRVQRVLSHGRITLTYDRRAREDRPDALHLRIRQAVNLLKLLQQPLIALLHGSLLLSRCCTAHHTRQ